MDWEGISNHPITTSPFTGSYQSSIHGLVTGNGHNLDRVKMSSANLFDGYEYFACSLHAICLEIMVTMDAMDNFMTEL